MIQYWNDGEKKSFFFFCISDSFQLLLGSSMFRKVSQQNGAGYFTETLFPYLRNKMDLGLQFCSFCSCGSVHYLIFFTTT